jgi:molybdopterin synthase sulfur carrier subunit
VQFGYPATALPVSSMIEIELTPHLFAFFPDLKGRRLNVQASTVAEVVQKLDELAPGIGFYICDERGSLRTHVNIFVGENRVGDRQRLTDAVPAGSHVYIMQALSGG